VTIYDELSAKAQTTDVISLDDIRRLAEVDVVVAAYLARRDHDMWSLDYAMRSCVCVLAAQLNATLQKGKQP